METFTVVPPLTSFGLFQHRTPKIKVYKNSIKVIVGRGNHDGTEVKMETVDNDERLSLSLVLNKFPSN